MSPTLSRIQVPGPSDPGTVILILAGDAADLLTLDLFLEGVTGGQKPAEVLRDLDLAAITITARHVPHGRTDRMYLTVQLAEAA